MRFERTCENLVITLPVQKNINTVLFIDGMAALYMIETRIIVVANNDLSIWHYLELKGMGMKDQVSTYLKMSLRECDKNRTLSSKYHEE